MVKNITPKILDCRAETKGLEQLADLGIEVRNWGWKDLTEFVPDVILVDEAIPDEVSEEYSAPLGRLEIGVIFFNQKDVDVCANLSEIRLQSKLESAELSQIIHLLAQNIRLRRRTIEPNNEQLLDWAFSDALTGLPNRRAWASKLRKMLESDHSICVAIVDIDFFKRVNQEHGHAVGDAVIAETAESIRRNLRGHDFVARLGGDEYGLLLSCVTRDLAAEILERVRDNLQDHLSGKGLPPVTISAGYAFSGNGVSARRERTAVSLYAVAAASLQRAKQEAEKNCTVGQIV